MMEKIVVLIVYFSLLLDNILLTVVVPILPDYLHSVDLLIGQKSDNSTEILSNSESAKADEFIREEAGPVGVLLSSKAFVQIVMNPIVGFLTKYCGYYLPMFVGTVNLLAATLLYAMGESYTSLFIARSLQGIASSCIGVSGMCLIAEHYPSEATRSKVMGIVLGSVALGVLLGYPFGGVCYELLGKMAPFLVIATLILVNIGFQLCFLDLKVVIDQPVVETTWSHLLADGYVALTAGSILISSSAMAILEPCLPVWLMNSIRPKKWQLGTVFIPDSLGYLIGTNFFGLIAYRLGRWRVATAAMLLVGVSAVLVPSAKTMSGLIAPHFGLGLGIGIVDAALVPLLANIVDTRHSAHYGSIYALQQTSVSLAYALGPMAGGELVDVVGFPWVMRVVGLMNIIYSPFLALLKQGFLPQEKETTLISGSETKVNYKTNEDTIKSTNYKRFFASDESD
ncbi:synaptic vesicular amine transporter-like [Nilaparvata lugens]|uniref:synaptic vesicular amine transporter-like n=1 Tax=Nilaparvata lugens TaxID=108931 RepID=UPI00193D991D|nr:synaptic vesicular amine transporter-like [Nilaparvata lugens]